jgi:hypothetical protein
MAGGCSSGTHDDGTGNCVASGCANSYHDGGSGICVASGSCSGGYHDDGTGKCVSSGCANGYHDGGAGACLMTGVCSTARHDDGTGVCVASGCASGYHDGGGGACVTASSCSAGFHDDGTSKCVASGCASGYHDGGGGICVGSGGCSSGFHDDGSGKCVGTGCANGFHDGGGGACVGTGTCSSGYHDDGSGKCVLSACASGYHDGGNGTCVATGTCAATFHDGGGGTCVLAGSCSGGFHDGGGGACVGSGTCSGGFHDDGSGKCVAAGCAAGYHDGGAGACVVAGNCSSGYHSDGTGACVATGCASAFHDGGSGVCVAIGNCSSGYHDNGIGACVASGCSGGYHDGGSGACVSSSTCSSGYHSDGTGVCVASGCAASYHDDGTGKCVASGCASGYHNGGNGACLPTGNCSTGYHNGGDGTCVTAGTCVVGYHTDAAGTCIAGTAALSGGTSQGFGNLEVGVASTGLTWTVSNTGTADTGTLLLTNGNPTEVMTINNCGTTIAAGAMCTITVSFKPSGPGARSGAVTLSASPGGSVTFTATASGKYRLTVATTGNGTVTSVQSGITCGTACSALFDAGPVTLQAHMKNGSSYLFSSWTGIGGCTGPLQNCTFTLGSSLSVGAVFTATTNNLIFVTQTTLPPNFGSASAYDSQCVQAAMAAGIWDGNANGYVAFTSDATSNAADRLGGARGWVRMDGRPFADTKTSLLTMGAVLNSIRYNEQGGVVGNSESIMTGGDNSGVHVDHNDCESWTGTGQMAVGNAEGGPTNWATALFGEFGGCTSSYHLICMGTTKTAPLKQSPIAGKQIWLSNQYLGTQTPDQECQADKPASVATAHALVSYSNQPASAVLNLTANYLRPDGTLVGTGQQLADAGALESGIWQFGNGTYPNSRTGLEVLTGDQSDNCFDWALPLSGISTMGLFDYGNGDSWWLRTTDFCSSSANHNPFVGEALYCVETP